MNEERENKSLCDAACSRKGFNVDYPTIHELNAVERNEVIELLLRRMNLRIWRDQTPDYSEIDLIENAHFQTSPTKADYES